MIRKEYDEKMQEIEKESQSASSEAAAPSAPDFSNLRKVKELS